MNLGKQLTIEGFITEEKSDLDRFREWWSEKNKENADHFPIQMDYGD